VYWEHIEPEEGKLTLPWWPILNRWRPPLRTSKLILLWFATWKNATMDYAPDWVKTNPARFKRRDIPSGKDLWNLSPFVRPTSKPTKRLSPRSVNTLKPTIRNAPLLPCRSRMSLVFSA